MPGLFISYRRDDQPGFAGRLADALERAFGADKVFRDIDDIAPGDDFVTALEQQLRSIDVMLVLIGPGWLAASRGGVRRLDDADDFVRREIEAAIKSGKPLLPVLIGGATMPGERDLPTSIAALARRQAIALSDPGWSSDVARLVQSIKPWLPAPRRRVPAWLAGAAGAIALLAVALLVLWPSAKTATTAQSEKDLGGQWTALVNYDWGAAHQERFDLRLEDGEVHGRATYLRVARGIEQGRYQAGQLSFVTHSEELLGDSRRPLTHRYRAQLKAGELHFVLDSSGGQSPHTPVEFIARRAAR